MNEMIKAMGKIKRKRLLILIAQIIIITAYLIFLNSTDPISVMIISIFIMNLYHSIHKSLKINKFIARIRDYIDKGSDYEFIGSFEKSFIINIEDVVKTKINITEDFLDKYGSCKGTYFNKYGYENELIIDSSRIDEYKTNDVYVKESIEFKVKNFSVVGMWHHSSVPFIQDDEYYQEA